MKGRVFIGWTTSQDLATLVKDKLEDLEFDSVVGGKNSKSQAESHNVSNFIGETIINQINSCNQAILIFSRKADGSISSNLLFELGYCMSRFAKNKIHTYFIDITNSDSDIPSDLRGIWALEISSNNKTQEEIAEAITNNFNNNNSIEIQENKMSLIDNWYTIRARIDSHYEQYRYSDYEIAMYFLFFTQSAYMYDMTNNAIETIKNFKKNMRKMSIELNWAIEICNFSLEIFNNTLHNNNGIYIAMDKCFNLYKKFEYIKKKLAIFR